MVVPKSLPKIPLVDRNGSYISRMHVTRKLPTLFAAFVLSGLATNAFVVGRAGATAAPGYSITGVCAGTGPLQELQISAQDAKADPNEGDAAFVAVEIEPGSHLTGFSNMESDNAQVNPDGSISPQTFWGGEPAGTNVSTYTVEVNSTADAATLYGPVVVNVASCSGTPTPTPAPAGASAVGMASTPDGAGYWIAYSNGAVHAHGDASDLPNELDTTHLNAPITHIVATPFGQGYWLVAADGGIFTYGDAPFYGSMGGQHLNAPVVDVAPTPDGRGYWLVASDGGIFSFGDAQFYGSTGALHLNKPVVGMAATPDGQGYWLVATDGGIFAFGSAQFYGSTGNIVLNKPVNGMAALPDGQGYWMVASDGGIFAFGSAQFYGSAGALHLNAPIVGMAASPTGTGYWLLGSDGGIFSYNAPFYGAD